MVARIQPPGFPSETLDLDRWLAFRGACPRLAPCAWRIFRNPLDGRFFVHDLPHSAEVVIASEAFGMLMFESGMLSVAGEPRLVLPVAFEVARELDCMVVGDDGAALTEPPSADLEAIARAIVGDKQDLPSVPVAVHGGVPFLEVREAFDFRKLWQEIEDVVEVHEERVPHPDLADIDLIHRYETDGGGVVDVYVKMGRVIRVAHRFVAD